MVIFYLIYLFNDYVYISPNFGGIIAASGALVIFCFLVSYMVMKLSCGAELWLDL